MALLGKVVLPLKISPNPILSRLGMNERGDVDFESASVLLNSSRKNLGRIEDPIWEMPVHGDDSFGVSYRFSAFPIRKYRSLTP